MVVSGTQDAVFFSRCESGAGVGVLLVSVRFILVASLLLVVRLLAVVDSIFVVVRLVVA